MSKQLVPIYYYVKWDDLVYGFKRNFTITNTVKDTEVCYRFSNKEDAIDYINDAIQHQIKMHNMLAKSLPTEPYRE